MANNSSPVVLSVSELTYTIKSQLEPLFRRINVRGEVANLRKQQSGHIYFSLIEGGCQLNAVFFRGNAASLSFPLKEGASIVAVGEISVYPPKGSYQLIVREMTPFGLGEALIKLQMLKKKLYELGWFKEERKRPLPVEISTIGLVTSPTGAVLHDIINVLTRRVGSFHIVVNPVRVQGEGAPLEIARAIREFSQYKLADVVIVCRGGGSSEDLSAFNDEKVAEACFKSAIPIVSAVGHETDLSITDLVADLRAPTPSAAAELVSKSRADQAEHMRSVKESIVRAMNASLRLARNRISSLSKQLQQITPRKTIESLSLRLDDLEESLFSKIHLILSHKKNLLAQLARACRKQEPRAKLQEEKTFLATIESKISEKLSAKILALKEKNSRFLRISDERMKKKMALICQQGARNFIHELQSSFSRILSARKQRLEFIMKNIETLHPQRTLERGYAIVFHEDEVVRSVKHMHTGDRVRIRVADGLCHALVQEKKENL